jgi:lipid-binding SYLF domain-containing protein
MTLLSKPKNNYLFKKVIMNKYNKYRFLILSLVLFLAACANTGATPDQKRQAIQNMKQEALTKLYEMKPDVRSQIQSARAVGVFSNANVNLILASFGGGYGVITDSSGADTYMKMGEIGVGLGAGVKDFRLIMVFHDQDALDRFYEYGVALGAQADAAAKASDQGAAIGAEATIDNITLYEITESGLALQATIKGTRYWRDEELN